MYRFTRPQEMGLLAAFIYGYQKLPPLYTAPGGEKEAWSPRQRFDQAVKYFEALGLSFQYLGFDHKYKRVEPLDKAKQAPEDEWDVTRAAWNALNCEKSSFKWGDEKALKALVEKYKPILEGKFGLKPIEESSRAPMTSDEHKKARQVRRLVTDEVLPPSEKKDELKVPEMPKTPPAIDPNDGDWFSVEADMLGGIDKLNAKLTKEKRLGKRSDPTIIEEIKSAITTAEAELAAHQAKKPSVGA